MFVSMRIKRPGIPTGLTTSTHQLAKTSVQTKEWTHVYTLLILEKTLVRKRAQARTHTKRK